MNRRILGIVAVTLLLAACNRQRSRPTGASTAEGAAQAVGPQTGVPAETSRPSPTPSAAPSVTIPAGTRIRVRLGESLDTRRSRPGTRFLAHLDSPIVSGDRVLVPAGTTFEGHVTEAKSSGRLKGHAYLGVTLDSFRLGGATYPIVTASDVRASKGHKKRNLVIIGGGSGGGAAIGAAAGGGVGAAIGAGAGAAAGLAGALITGKRNVTLPVETPLVFSLRQPVAMIGST